jgi:hypothetical protein
MKTLKDISRETIYPVDSLKCAAKMLEYRGMDYSAETIAGYCRFAAKLNMNLFELIGRLAYASEVSAAPKAPQ